MSAPLTLHQAVNFGDIKRVTELLAEQDIDVRDEEDRSPLHIAASAFGTNSSLDLVNLLLNKGANVNLQDKKSWTPLHYAASYQHIKIVRLLLRNNADVNLVTDSGESVLHLLARIPCDLKSSFAKVTSKELIELLMVVMSKGAKVNLQDLRGISPLHEAATKGSKKIVEFLLKHGADVNATNSQGESPLQIATLFGNKDASKVLIAHGADRTAVRRATRSNSAVVPRVTMPGIGNTSGSTSKPSSPQLQRSFHAEKKNENDNEDKERAKDKKDKKTRRGTAAKPQTPTTPHRDSKDKDKDKDAEDDDDLNPPDEPEDEKAKELVYVSCFEELPNEVHEMAQKENLSIELLNQHFDVVVSVLRFLTRKNYRVAKKEGVEKGIADENRVENKENGTIEETEQPEEQNKEVQDSEEFNKEPNEPKVTEATDEVEKPQGSEETEPKAAQDEPAKPQEPVELQPIRYSPTKIAEEHDPAYYEDASVLVNTTDNPSKIYKALEKAGKGGFGSVYQAKNLKKKQDRVALKIMSHSTPKEQKFNFNEIHFLNICIHPNIVKYLAAYQNQGKKGPEIWVVMEFMEGGTLKQVVKRNLKETQIAYVSKEVLKGLKFLHERNFVHRDLKSNNIMLSIEGDVKIIDFGLCIDITNGQSNRMVGSPFWVPPEMIQRLPHGTPADIWSFAICILEMTNGDPPNRKYPLKCLFNYGTGQLPGFDKPDNWSNDFKDFMSRCLKFDPKERDTAEQLLGHPFIAKAETRKSMKHILQSIFIEKALQTTLGLG